jgi:hypothetical protein
MGNHITSKRSTDLLLDMSNGGTDVVLSVLTLAGTALATTDWERRFVAWLAEHDQAFFGLGVVGFDLDTVPWGEEWPAHKDFFLRVIDLARSGFRYGDLGYDPPFVKAQLVKLRSIVESVNEAVVSALALPFEHLEEPVERCEDHDVYRHAYGCILCSDEVPPCVKT